MGRRDEHRAELRALGREDWVPYLLEHSGLPGPRANLELVQAVADEADAARLEDLLATGEEYPVLCATVGLGRLLAERATGGVEQRLRSYASDNRWRVREGVAMALQRLGDADPSRLFDLAADWVRDRDPLVQRAAVAGVCEPRLLKTSSAAASAIDVCELATRSLATRQVGDRKDDGARTLRQALGYGWSVAVAADPSAGLPRFQAITEQDDPDIAWITRENARKSRLARLL
jgi:hypothetical protein